MLMISVAEVGLYFQVRSEERKHLNEALDEALKNLALAEDNICLKTGDEPLLGESDSAILRKKETNTQKMTDEEVFAELRRICHPGDPYRRFERSTELGAG
jgi:2-phospho-L-lactate guanylyltransferase (CobY/MobA/RfbA family)